MTHFLACLPTALCSALLILVLTAQALLPAGDVPPAIPEALAGVEAQVKGFPGMIGKWGLSIRSRQPLNESQWAAVGSIPVTSFLCAGAFIDADGLAQLAKLRVESLILQGCRAEGDAVEAFARMTALRRLAFSHCRLGPSIAPMLARLPALEDLTSDHQLVGDGIGIIASAPLLRRIRLGHSAASDRAAKSLEGNRTLEAVDFWATGAPVLSEAGVQSLTTLSGLKSLSFSNTVVTYAGSLHRLKELPLLTALTLDVVDISVDDLALVQADLPQVTITATRMTAEQRMKWDVDRTHLDKHAEVAARKAAAEASETDTPTATPTATPTEPTTK